MTTERQVETVVGFAHAWADSLDQSARMCGQMIEAGDPHGHGIQYLHGMVRAYEDAAAAIRAQAEDLQSERRDERKARLVVVS